MNYTENQCAPSVQQAATAHELMLDVFLADSIPAIKATLTDFFLEYMLNEVIDLADRHRAVFHYRVLTDALTGIEQLGEKHYQHQQNKRA